MRNVAYKNDNSGCLHFLLMSLDPYFSSCWFPEHNSRTVKNILMVHVHGKIINNRSMRSVACKNDNFANLRFLIMSPDPYFTSFSFLESNSALI